MNTQTPNRNGWMTGARSDTLACPPFPDFTDFERQALESTAPQFGDLADAFRAQIKVAEVVDRINTMVGFYTRVKVDRAKSSPAPLRYRDAHLRTAGAIATAGRAAPCLLKCSGNETVLQVKFLERLKLILGYSQRNAFLPAGIERRDGAQAPITRPRSKAHVCGTRR